MRLVAYVSPTVKAEMEQDPRLSLGALIEEMWRERDHTFPLSERRGKSSPPPPGLPQEVHVCSSWRLNAIGKNVCTEPSCQKPKNR